MELNRKPEVLLIEYLHPYTPHLSMNTCYHISQICIQVVAMTHCCTKMADNSDNQRKMEMLRKGSLFDHISVQCISVT